MKTNISELKSHLSERIKEVKSGKTILVLERNTPVAKLVPIETKHREKHSLKIRPKKENLINMKLKIKLPVDVNRIISEDREDKWFAT